MHAGNRDNSTRTALLASVAHDLKTPLVSVIGSLSTLLFLKDGLSSSDKYDLLMSAYLEAERLHRIVHNTLEMAKLESGFMLTQKEPIDLLDIVKISAQRIKKVYPNFNIKIENHLDGIVPLGDELLMSQVIYNLLENAAKYGPHDHHVLVEVLVELDTNATKQMVYVQITDHGCGIDEADIPKIFGKFYRSPFTQHLQPGSGLGLAICRSIVESHGGIIEARSRTDGVTGTIFKVSLPAVSISDADLERTT